jgi:hypothetical protein
MAADEPASSGGSDSDSKPLPCVEFHIAFAIIWRKAKAEQPGNI